MKKSKKDYPYNLLEDCGIDTEREKLPEDIEGTIYYLLYARKKPLNKRNADLVMDYYHNIRQSEIARKYGMTRQRVLIVLKKMIQYLSKPENAELLRKGVKNCNGHSDGG